MLQKNQTQMAVDNDDEEEIEQAEFAMKMMHKPTLKRERAIRYDE